MFFFMCVLLLYERFVLCFIYMLTDFLVALVSFVAFSAAGSTNQACGKICSTQVMEITRAEQIIVITGIVIC